MVLLDVSNTINIIHPIFANELGLSIRLTNIKAQKSDVILQDIYRIIVATFWVTDKINQVKIFEKTFLVANIGLEMVLGMLFLTLSSVNINFLDWKLWWKTYTTQKTLPNTRYIEQMRKKEFAIIALDLEYEIFIVHVVSFSSTLLIYNVYSFHRP